MSGHRRALEMMIAFSTLFASAGSPAAAHARSCTASPSVAARPAPALCVTRARASADAQSAWSAAR